MGAPAVARPAPARRAAPKRAAKRRARPATRRATSKTAARRKPRPNAALASRPAAPRSTGVAQPALAGAALIPHAAVRTAGAVRDISDSSVIVRLTAGRGWIAVLGLLLSGIVALNVISLSISSTSGRVSQAIDEYGRQNSSLRGQLAEQLSAGRVQDAATRLGLAVPSPDDVTYLDAKDNDLEQLAKALTDDSIMVTDSSYDSGSYTGTESSYTAPTTDSSSSVTPSAPTSSSTPPSSPAPTPAAPAPSSGGGGGATGGVGL